MSGTGKRTGGSRSYFQEIEREFIRLRGTPFLLSAADWKVADSWRQRAIPLDVVLEGMRDVFARRLERGAAGKVQSLRYCADSVEAQWRARLELGGAAPEAAREPAVAERLRRLAEALTGDALVAVRESVLELAGEAPQVEQALREIEDRFLDSVEARLSGGRKREIETRVDAARRRLPPDTPAEAVDAMAERIRRDELRREVGIPRLSLVSPLLDG